MLKEALWAMVEKEEGSEDPSPVEEIEVLGAEVEEESPAHQLSKIAAMYLTDGRMLDAGEPDETVSEA